MARFLQNLCVSVMAAAVTQAAYAAVPMSDSQLEGVTAGAAVVIETGANGGGGLFGAGLTKTKASAGYGGAAGAGIAIAAGAGPNANAQTSGQSAGYGAKTLGHTVTPSMGGSGAPFALSLTLTQGFAFGR